jgi:hypothetical protein
MASPLWVKPIKPSYNQAICSRNLKKNATNLKKKKRSLKTKKVEKA